MRIMPPDDPTAVYPIGQVGPLDTDPDDEAKAEEDAPASIEEEPEPVVPPIEPAVAEVSKGGGFNPLIAVAVLAVGMFMALTVVGLTGVILLLIQ